MADTVKGDFSDQKCSDCGELGCCFKHWGELVPPGEIGFFCAFCLPARDKLGDPASLGVKPPGIPVELSVKDVIKVTTHSGSVYKLSLLPDSTEERIVSCEQKELGFSRARVISLVKGESLFLKPRDSEDLSLWQTSTVDSIE